MNLGEGVRTHHITMKHRLLLLVFYPYLLAPAKVLFNLLSDKNSILSQRYIITSFHVPYVAIKSSKDKRICL
jgi:hypothetical protein